MAGNQRIALFFMLYRCVFDTSRTNRDKTTSQITTQVYVFPVCSPLESTWCPLSLSQSLVLWLVDADPKINITHQQNYTVYVFSDKVTVFIYLFNLEQKLFESVSGNIRALKREPKLLFKYKTIGANIIWHRNKNQVL